MSGRGKGGGGLGKRCLDRYAESADSGYDSECEIVEAKRVKAEQKAEWELRKAACAEASKQEEIREAALIKQENEAQEKQQEERKAAYDKYKAEIKARTDMEYAAQLAIQGEKKIKLQEIAKKQTKKPLLFIYEACETVITVVADHPAFDQFSGFVSRKDFERLFDGYAQIAESMGTEVPSKKFELMVDFFDAFSSPALGAETRGTVMLTGPESDSDSEYDSDCDE